MNEYDSQQMIQVLSGKGFEETKTPESADLLIINSCSVREKSENKALSQLGRFASLKKSDPSKVLAFGGCVGQTEGPKIKSRFPFLDFVFGTNNYRDLPQMIEPFEKRWETNTEDAQEMDESNFENLIPSFRPLSKAQAFITITNGCDKFCSYCIVPFTRGREISRSPEEILREASQLVQRGAKEIMLLGQNVNSYWGKTSQGAFTSLCQLLELFQRESERGGQLEGLKRLRYTTSHPRDFDENLARAHRDLPVLCEYLHLPFQAGSDLVLRKMRRFYTAKDYLRKMEMVKKYRSDIALSTDVIVGFPGETREDFEATLSILKEVEFDNVYSFKYSIRPYTRSAKWVDDISAQEKGDRIQELLKVQRKIGLKKYQEDIGQTVEVMLEGESKSDSRFWTARTRKNRVVHLPRQSDFELGEFAMARVLNATHSWLLAEVPDKFTSEVAQAS